MAERNKDYLLIDLGNTLIRSTKPGAGARITSWLEKNNVRGIQSERIKDMLFSAPNFQNALMRIANFMNLTRNECDELETQLSAKVEAAVEIQGASEFLMLARELGWSLVAVSNVVAWEFNLPKRLHSLFDEILLSSDLGASKHQPEFWNSVLTHLNVDKESVIAMGDSLIADQEIPTSLGLASLQIGMGTERSLARAGQYLKSMGPRPSDDHFPVSGEITEWAGHRILSLPAANHLVNAVTRAKLELTAVDLKQRSSIVRRNGLSPVLLVPNEWCQSTILCWGKLLGEQRHPKTPSDFSRAIEAAGFNLDEIPSAEKRQIVSMIREARSPEIRQERINDAIIYIKDLVQRRSNSGLF